MDTERKDYLTLPDLHPERIGMGVWNQSGFSSLREIRVASNIQSKDTILILNWVMEDIEMLIEKWKQKETEIVEQTLAVMRQNMAQNLTEREPLVISHGKAAEMSSFLKQKLLAQSGSRMIV